MNSSSQSADLIVIGAGAAGLAAAIEAARFLGQNHARRILILEKNDRPGRKILATGNGRCNITNLQMSVSSLHGENPVFAKPALERFSVGETLSFFLSLGLPCREESEGRMYPSCQQAAAVLDVLLKEAMRLGIEILTERDVSHIEQLESLKIGDVPLVPHDRWHITVADGQSFVAACLILATGGLAAPNLGSDGSGLKIALQLGHPVIPPFPALVQIETLGRKTQPISGVRIETQLTLKSDQQILARESGEVLFTDYGLSGIPIMQISRQVNQWLNRQKTPLAVELDLLPELTESEILCMIRNRIKLLKDLSLGDLLTGLVHQKISRSLTRETTGLSADFKVRQLSPQHLTKLASAIKHDRFEIKGTRDFSQAQVTAGGLSCQAFNPLTLESLVTPGLFAAGELLDLDGDCGGYNLQWAWSSGRLAGLFAAQSVLDLEHHHV